MAPYYRIYRVALVLLLAAARDAAIVSKSSFSSAFLDVACGLIIRWLGVRVPPAPLSHFVALLRRVSSKPEIPRGLGDATCVFGRVLSSHSFAPSTHCFTSQLLRPVRIRLSCPVSVPVACRASDGTDSVHAPGRQHRPLG